MKPESIVLTVAGMCFGVIVGWVLADLDAGRTGGVVVPSAAVTPPQPQAAESQGPPPLDEARVQALTTILSSDPTNAGAAIELGSTYFEAEQFEEAVDWYEEALRLDPKSAEASTQLGMTFFFTRGADPALEQLERSLEIDPSHPRTLLSKGIVLWQGKQDLEGAAEAWQTLVALAPDSPEAQAAQQGLQAIAAGRQSAQSPSNNQ